MTEVTLVKRFYVFTLVALIALGATACTRDKPAEPTPAATTIALSSSSASSLSAASASASSSSSVTSTVPVTTTSSSSSSASASSSAVPPVVPTATPATTPGTYTVKWGDWLNKIAQENGVTVQAILAANPGLNPNLIYPGQVINIPAPGSSSSSSASSSASSSSSSTPSGNPSSYTVQRGDWIYALARKFNVSVAALLAANPGIHANLLYPGQVLNIPSDGGTPPPDGTPSSDTYTVQPGDTLFSIAIRYRTTVYAFQIKNNLANPHFIYPGQVLKIPK